MIALSVCIAAILLVALLFMLVNARHQRQLGGLPDGELIYSDSQAQACPVLVSYRYGIKGKPDALVRTESGDIIPVERKRGRAPRQPDLIQAAAYCILVEDQYGRTPPFMRIQYADRWFDEPSYAPDRKAWVLRTAGRLREARNRPDCNRSHRIPGKCRNCGQKQNCGQAL